MLCKPYNENKYSMLNKIEFHSLTCLSISYLLVIFKLNSKSIMNSGMEIILLVSGVFFNCIFLIHFCNLYYKYDVKVKLHPLKTYMQKIL